MSAKNFERLELGGLYLTASGVVYFVTGYTAPQSKHSPEEFWAVRAGKQHRVAYQPNGVPASAKCGPEFATNAKPRHFVKRLKIEGIES